MEYLFYPTQLDKFQFQVKDPGDVRVNVKDALGREVTRILDKKMPSGKYTYVADLSELSEGFYILTVTTTETTQRSKIIISK